MVALTPILLVPLTGLPVGRLQKKLSICAAFYIH